MGRGGEMGGDIKMGEMMGREGGRCLLLSRRTGQLLKETLYIMKALEKA